MNVGLDLSIRRNPSLTQIPANMLSYLSIGTAFSGFIIIDGSPIASIHKNAFESFVYRSMTIVTTSLRCCNHEHLLNRDLKLTSTSKIVCGFPSDIAGRDLLLPVADGGLNSQSPDYTICENRCPNGGYAIHPGTEGSNGVFTFECADNCPPSTGPVQIENRAIECFQCTLPSTGSYALDSNCANCTAGDDPDDPYRPSTCTACSAGYLYNPVAGCVAACSEAADGSLLLNFGATAVNNDDTGSASSSRRVCHRCTDPDCAHCRGRPDTCDKCFNGKILHLGQCGTSCPNSTLKDGAPQGSENDADYLERWVIDGVYDPVAQEQVDLRCRQAVSRDNSRPLVSLQLIPSTEYVVDGIAILAVNITDPESRTISGLALSDFVISPASMAVRSVLPLLKTVDMVYYVRLLLRTEGTHSVQLPQNVLRDEAGNFNYASNTLTFVHDNTPPTVTFSQKSLRNFDVIFSEPRDTGAGLDPPAAILRKGDVIVSIDRNMSFPDTKDLGVDWQVTSCDPSGDYFKWRCTIAVVPAGCQPGSTYCGLPPAFRIYMRPGKVKDRAGNYNLGTVSPLYFPYTIGNRDLVCDSNSYRSIASASDGESYVCIPCPANSTTALRQDGATSVTDCVCETGFFNSADRPDLAVECRPCRVCGEGQYRLKSSTCIGARDYVCQNCPPNSLSEEGSVGVDACFCHANYYDMAELGGVSCAACPPNSTSVIGSVDPRHCACDFGFFDAAPDDITSGNGDIIPVVSCQACTICAENHYRRPQTTCGVPLGNGAESDYDCVRCPGNSSSDLDSLTGRGCTCNAGYFDASAPKESEPECVTCTPCDRGKIQVSPCDGTSDTRCEWPKFTVIWNFKENGKEKTGTDAEETEGSGGGDDGSRDGNDARSRALFLPVLNAPYSMEPVPSNVTHSVSVETYSALGLPCGMSANRDTGHLQGTPTVAGIFNVTLQATSTPSTGSLVAVVNDKPLAMEVRECDDQLSCNGGICIRDNAPYDGVFSCDCSGTEKTGSRCTETIVRQLRVNWPARNRNWPHAILGKPYRLESPADVDIEGHSGLLEYSASGLPCGLDMDASSGGVSGVPGKSGVFDSVNVFGQTGQQSARVNVEAFALEVIDCDSESSCNGGACIDEDPHDGVFGCDCSGTGTTGSFCELAAVEMSTDGQDSSNASSLAIGASLGSLLLIVAAALAIWRVRVHRKRNRPLSFNESLEKMRALGLLRADDTSRSFAERGPREIRRKCVTVLEKIGEGAFGEVSKGFLDEEQSRGTPGFTVALKVMKDTSEGAIHEFTGEAALMADLRHRNIIGLLGVVTRGEPKMMVVAYCGNGDLKGFLKRMADALKSRVQLGICHDIANGMAYLASRHLVHRDLAARNVLIADDFTCKVSDFGMARQLEDEGGSSGEYYRSVKGTAIPVRWTAPEALEERKYTEASDVWAFGVTCYEVFTAAATPYEGMSNQMVLVRVKDGYRLSCPEGCSRSVFDTHMKPCWAGLAADRPTFKQLELGLASVAGNRKTLAKAVSGLRQPLQSGHSINSSIAGSSGSGGGGGGSSSSSNDLQRGGASSDGSGVEGSWLSSSSISPSAAAGGGDYLGLVGANGKVIEAHDETEGVEFVEVHEYGEVNSSTVSSGPREVTTGVVSPGGSGGVGEPVEPTFAEAAMAATAETRLDQAAAPSAVYDEADGESAVADEYLLVGGEEDQALGGELEC